MYINKSGVGICGTETTLISDKAQATKKTFDWSNLAAVLQGNLSQRIYITVLNLTFSDSLKIELESFVTSTGTSY